MLGVERLELMADGGICLADWLVPAGTNVTAPVDLRRMLDGVVFLGSIPYLVNKWVELLVDGRRQWRWRVGEKEPRYDSDRRRKHAAYMRQYRVRQAAWRGRKRD